MIKSEIEGQEVYNDNRGVEKGHKINYNKWNHINKDIDGNFRRSDMVTQVNQKLVNALYNYSFERLKKEDGSDKDFIELIKVMT